MSEGGGRSATDLALAALARREHSRLELEQKLAAKGMDAADIAPALDALSAKGLQDDRRFAEAYTRHRAGRGYGPRRIAGELQQRGIDGELAQQVLVDGENDWQGTARAVWRKKFGTPPASWEERAKQTRFMEYRGFYAEQVRHAIEQAVGDEDI